MSEGATTPKPPYYCVIFTSRRKPGIEDDYGAASARMMELGTKMPGFLGIESARNTEGFGITVSYWRSEEDIRAWKRNAEHALAREQGRSSWYEHYELRVAKVERAYGGPPA